MISVVMAVRDGLPWLEDQLEALAAQRIDEEWELVVADNGSEDASRDVVREWIARRRSAPNCVVRLVDASKKRGPAPARNEGVRAASGEIVAFCDADDVVDPGWLAACVEATRPGPAGRGFDVVAGTFDFSALNADASPSPTSAGPKASTPRSPASMSQLGFLPAGLASNLAVRRSAFEAVGGFSEDLMVGEDIDLCWRLQLAGYSFGIAQDALVARREPAALRDVFRQAWSYGRSGPDLYRRHRGSGAGRALAETARSWAWIVLNVPRIGRPALRRQWVRATGMRLGRIAGSVRQKVFLP